MNLQSLLWTSATFVYESVETNPTFFIEFIRLVLRRIMQVGSGAWGDQVRTHYCRRYNPILNTDRLKHLRLIWPHFKCCHCLQNFMAICPPRKRRPEKRTKKRTRAGGQSHLALRLCQSPLLCINQPVCLSLWFLESPFIQSVGHSLVATLCKFFEIHCLTQCAPSPPLDDLIVQCLHSMQRWVMPSNWIFGDPTTFKTLLGVIDKVPFPLQSDLWEGCKIVIV